MGDTHERLAFTYQSNSNGNDFEDDFDFYLSDINHETPKCNRPAKIRILNDKSTCISPGGDLTAANTDESSQHESQKCDEDLIEDLASYKKSIDELRKESRILLQRSPRKEKLQKELKAVLQRPKEDLTILKLLWHDRERIGLMISDLAEAKQTIFDLNSQILKQREKGKIMRNWANKKIDALEERVEMLKAKEKYKAADRVESLKELNNKLSEAHKEAEASAKQTEKLKVELTELAKVAQENKELREKLALLKRTSKEYRKKEQDYLSAIQRKAKTTQTEYADLINAESDLEKNKQGKRKLNANSQKTETVHLRGIRFPSSSEEKNEDKYKIRKNVPSGNAHKQSDTQTNNLDDQHTTDSSSLHLTTSTKAIVDLDSDEDDLIRELFFKF